VTSIPKILVKDVRKLPISPLAEMQAVYPLVRRLKEASADHNRISQSFLQLIRSKFTTPTLSRALENWPGLEFKGFLSELKKAKVQLTLAEEAEWLSYFTAEKAKAQALQAQIAKTDKEIDALVHQLYGLTEEEVKVVEGK